MSISRRHFLAMSGGAAGSVVIGGTLWAALVRDQVNGAAVQSGGTSITTTSMPGPTSATSEPLTSPAAGRVLVILQMGGGNDALNTVVPVGDGRYRDLRPNIGLPEDTLLALAGDDRYALHAALQPLLPWWEAGHLGILQGIGLEGQSRSHFASMDTWWSATPGKARTTGWLGRWLDATGDGTNPLRAISLGDGSPAIVGEKLQATFVRDPASFTLRAPAGADADQIAEAFLATAEPLATDPLLAAAQRAVPASFEALDLLAAATGTGGGDPFAGGGGQGPTATSLLETAAGIIDLEVGTQVIVVGISGFDTHSNQPDDHARLLGDVAGGLAAFLSTMEDQGRADDVLVMTTSEFGRRAQDNLSLGCDHGSGGTLFLAGSSVQGQLVGDVDLGNLVEGDVAIDIDTRSLYSVALDWLGGPTEEILEGNYDRYGLLV